MKNAILLAKKQECVSQKCKNSYFSTKYRISAQNRIRPWSLFVGLTFYIRVRFWFFDASWFRKCKIPFFKLQGCIITILGTQRKVF